MPQQHVLVTDARLPEDHFIFEGLDVSEEPTFSISEVAKVFFGRSTHWIRWKERKGEFILDGEEVGRARTPVGARRYSLADVEKMAHALAEKDSINAAQLANALVIAKTCAKVWGHIG